MATQLCFHCSQAIPAGEVVTKAIIGKSRDFCCHGCAGVCDVIYEAGMESFYKRIQDGEQINPPPPPSADISFLDYDEVQSQFVAKLSKTREITLISEAIHCAACIWLIEHTLARIDSVKMAKVNFTNKQIKIRWDNDKINLSELVKILNDIGYDASPYDASESEAAFRKANRDLLYRLGYAGFAMMNVMWIAIALYAGADEDPQFRSYFHWVSFVIATTVILYSAKPFFMGAVRSLRAKTVGMDVSISLGILTTYFYSFWVTVDVDHSGDVYFDTMVDFVFLLLIGRYLEAIYKNKAIDSTKRLMQLQPKIARQQTEQGIEVVPVRKLVAGNVVLVKPGDKIPVDGVLLSGAGNIDESMLTGESKEIRKKTGDRVYAGTHNLDGALTVEVVAILQNTSLGKIVNMVEEAQGSKAPIQRIAERIMPWFVSIVLVLATLSFVYWILAADLEVAMIAATSVLIITCPCAFGLATPMATAVASGVSASHGILIRNGAVLEVLNSIDHFVFDKTGTLTKGQMALSSYHLAKSVNEQKLLSAVLAVEKNSEHSLAKALCSHLAENFKLDSKLEAINFTAHAGKGLSADVFQDGIKNSLQIGSLSWVTGFVKDIPENFLLLAENNAKLSQTAVWVAKNGRIVAIFFLEDELRDGAVELIARLHERGKKITILSGDRQLVAESVADKLTSVENGINVIAEVLPEDKYDKIKQLQEAGEKVAMIGDGINDAPALVCADVSFALGSGTDVSMDSSDIVILNSKLLSIDTAIDLSARTLKTIHQNIASSIVYNIIFVPLAMAAMMTPLIAAITMPLSSILVIGNAARIRNFYSKKAMAKRDLLRADVIKLKEL